MTEDNPETKPWRDPIVADVRKVREALFAAAGHDVHEFCRRLREREAASEHPVIRARNRPKAEPCHPTSCR